jgi:repressor LexA
LCAEFGWASTGTARDHLQALARKGYITLSGGRARQVRLVEAPAAVARVRMLGRVVAGRPEAAAEVDDGEIAVPAAWVGGGRHFALAVDGDSMIGAGIHDGDYVIVRQQQDPQAGEIVVALVDDNTTTVKRLARDGERFVLQPENPNHRPIPIESKAAAIQGVVIGLMREYRVRGSSRWSPRSVAGSQRSVARRRSRVT